MLTIKRNSPIFGLYQQAFLRDRGWLDWTVVNTERRGFGVQLREVQTYRKTKSRYDRKPAETRTQVQADRLEKRRNAAFIARYRYRDAVTARYSRRKAYQLEQSLLKPHSFCPYFWAIMAALVWYLPVVKGIPLLFLTLFRIAAFLLTPVTWTIKQGFRIGGRHPRVTAALAVVGLLVWSAPTIVSVAHWAYQLPSAMAEDARWKRVAEERELERRLDYERHLAQEAALDAAAEREEQIARALWEQENPGEVAWDKLEANLAKAQQEAADARYKREQSAENWRFAGTLALWVIGIIVGLGLLAVIFSFIEDLWNALMDRLADVELPEITLQLPGWMGTVGAWLAWPFVFVARFLSGCGKLFIVMAKAVHEKTCPLQQLEPAS